MNITWSEAIKACDDYIDLLITKLHSMDAVDSKFKEMWRQKIAVAMVKRQEAVARQRQEKTR